VDKSQEQASMEEEQWRIARLCLIEIPESCSSQSNKGPPGFSAIDRHLPLVLSLHSQDPCSPSACPRELDHQAPVHL
jgi:hypothetical protein